MKSKIKSLIIIVVVVILLIPIPFKLKDGGSKEFKSLLYSITKVNRLNHSGIEKGIEIKVLNIPLYNTTHIEYSSKLKELYASYNKYLGDVSKDIKIMNLLEVEKFGKYTINLKTDEEPYILYINFDYNEELYITNDCIYTNEEEKAEALKKRNKLYEDLRKRAILLITLIENLDQVEYLDIFDKDKKIIINKTNLEEEFGNIKDYNKTIERFEKLLTKLDYNKL